MLAGARQRSRGPRRGFFTGDGDRKRRRGARGGGDGLVRRAVRKLARFLYSGDVVGRFKTRQRGRRGGGRPSDGEGRGESERSERPVADRADQALRRRVLLPRGHSADGSRRRRGRDVDSPRRTSRAAAAVEIPWRRVAPRDESATRRRHRHRRRSRGDSVDPPSEYPRGAPRRGRDPPSTTARLRYTSRGPDFSKLFRSADASGEGTLDLKEFTSAVRRVLKIAPGKLLCGNQPLVGNDSKFATKFR